jgi:hypothetical protein
MWQIQLSTTLTPEVEEEAAAKAHHRDDVAIVL